MAFRDDKDALDQRLADLEQDLKQAREGLDRKDEELRRLRARMGGLDKATPRARPVGLIVGLSVALVTAGAGLFVSMRSAPRSAPQPAMPSPPAAPLPAIPPAVTPVTPNVPPAPAPSPGPTAKLTWKATARSATGTFAEIRPGTKCTVEVTATGGTALDLHRVAVRCGDAVLYDSAARATGTMMSQTSGSMREKAAPGAAGAFVYQLLYQDTGTRSLDARPQLEIGTERRIARVFHEGALGGAVDLTIDPVSQPRSGEALVTKAN